MASINYAIRVDHGFLTSHDVWEITGLTGLFLNDIDSKRKISLDFHIKSDDYFGTLATILNLLRESSSQNRRMEQQHLAEVVEDLLHLQKHYKIIRKDQ